MRYTPSPSSRVEIPPDVDDFGLSDPLPESPVVGAPEPPVTLGELAENVTPDTLPILLQRLAKENHVESYQRAIISEAANTLTLLFDDLWKDFRKIGKSKGADQSTKLTVINAADMLLSDPPPPDQIIENTFDAGDKVAIIATSKGKKTTTMIHLAVSLATGRDFIGLRVAKKRRVLIVQVEVTPGHYHRRVKTIAAGRGVSAKELSNLLIINGRGLGLNASSISGEICRIAIENNIEVIGFDPIYKFMEAGENDVAAFRPILSAFDYFTSNTGAAIIYSHHDPKGEAGDRNIQDRGAGSSILARDYDAAIVLSSHGSGNSNMAVVDFLLRSYPERQSISIEWDGLNLKRRDDLPPQKRNSRNKIKADELPLSSYEQQAIEIVKNKPMKISVYKDMLRKNCVLTVRRVEAVIDFVTGSGTLAVYAVKARGRNEKWIGLPAAIEKMAEKKATRVR